MDVSIELSGSSVINESDTPVISLAADTTGGSWITVGGTHIFIKDGAGSRQDQVATFLSSKANNSAKSEDHTAAASAQTDKAKASGSLADYATAAAHQHSATAYDALKGDVKQKIDGARAAITSGINHLHDIAGKTKSFAGDKLDQAKNIIGKGVHRTEEIAQAAKAYPGKKLAETKQSIGDKAKAVVDDVSAKKAWLASKYHGAAAIVHQVAGDMQGLAGNKIMQDAHTAMADKHMNERDKLLAGVADHASKVAAAHTANATFGKDLPDQPTKDHSANPVRTASEHFDKETQAATAHVDAQLANRHVAGNEAKSAGHDDQAAQHVANAHTVAHGILDGEESHDRVGKALGYDDASAKNDVKQGSSVAQQAMKFAQAHYDAAKASVKAGDKDAAHNHLMKSAVLAELAHKSRADELNKSGDLEGEKKQLLATAHAHGQLLALKSAKPDQIMTRAEAQSRHDAMMKQHADESVKTAPKVKSKEDSKAHKQESGKEKPEPKEKPEHEVKEKHEAKEKPEHEPKEKHERTSGGGMRSGGGDMSRGTGGNRNGKQRRKIRMPAKHLGLSLMDSVDDYLLMPGETSSALALSGETTADGKPIKRFRKEIIREGDFQKASDNLAFTVTRDSLNHWVNTFGDMQKNGVDVYFPAGHTNKPEANRGYWRKLEIAPSTKDPHILALWGEVDAIGEDGISLIGRTDVSLYSPRDLTDGEGHNYKRPIVHIAACVDPVIPGLSPWQSVAASMEGNDDAGALHATVLIPFAPTADDTGTVTMIADGLEPDEGQVTINEKALFDLMLELKPGQRIAGVKYMGDAPIDPNVDNGSYDGMVRSVRQANSLNGNTSPLDVPRNFAVVLFDSGDGVMKDVLSCEPHIMFVRYRAELDAGDPKPASLSLDGNKDVRDDGTVKPADADPPIKTGDVSADTSASNQNVPDPQVADKLTNDAQFVAEAQARARGCEPDKTDKDKDADAENDNCSLSLAWNKGIPMTATTVPVEQQTDDVLVASLETAAIHGDAATQAAVTAEIEARTISLSSDGGPDTCADYAYCPNASDKSTWKLPIHDAVHVSAAAAALSAGGFRGQKVDIPADAADAVKAKVRTAWQKYNPDKTAADMPESIKASHESSKKCKDCDCDLTGDAGEKDGMCKNCCQAVAASLDATVPAPAAAVPAIEQPAQPAQPAVPARKGLNIAVILNRLGYEDLSGVTVDNAEEMVLSGIDALEARITEEADTALSLSRQEMETQITAAQNSSFNGHSSHKPSDIELNLMTDNMELRLSNLVTAGRLTPAAAKELKGVFNRDKLALSLSQGDDTLTKVLEVIAHNEPVHLTELTGAQTKNAVQLNRKTGMASAIPNDDGEATGANPELLADAERRRKEWEDQQRRASSSR